jgi:Family of unknown function (DUF6325)
MTADAPVQFIAVGFGPDAEYEGRILAELEKLENSGMLHVRDLLFVLRDESGELVTRPGVPGRPTIVSQEDVDEVASGLAPGQAAGLVLIEHSWARDLEEAVADTGGVILQQGMLQ